MSRITLHGSRALVATFEAFQLDAPIDAQDGRRRLVVVVRGVWHKSGRDRVDERATGIPLFGHEYPRHCSCQSGTRDYCFAAKALSGLGIS